MKDVVWDDYVRAKIDAIDHVRARLGVPHVHTIGYCVAGTTLAATLAVLARRGGAAQVKSAPFFTALVDFEISGEVRQFRDDGHHQMIQSTGHAGYPDGRHLAGPSTDRRRGG